jgi:hypothetical protein
MEKWSSLSRLNDEQFRRLTGVQRGTFAKMSEILAAAHAAKKARGGRPNAMGVPDMLLMALEYLREYRTYFHVGASRGICESTAYETIRWVEDTLIKDGTFRLPGKKALLQSHAPIEVVLIDATESPVERPKKNSGGGIPAKRNGTR